MAKVLLYVMLVLLNVIIKPSNMRKNCDVGTTQCEDRTVKCEKKVKEPPNVTKELSHVTKIE